MRTAVVLAWRCRRAPRTPLTRRVPRLLRPRLGRRDHGRPAPGRLSRALRPAATAASSRCSPTAPCSPTRSRTTASPRPPRALDGAVGPVARAHRNRPQRRRLQDSTTPLLGVAGPGASPRRFRGDRAIRLASGRGHDEPGPVGVAQGPRRHPADRPAKAQVYWYQSACSRRAATTRTRCPSGCRPSTPARAQQAAGTRWTLLRRTRSTTSRTVRRGRTGDVGSPFRTPPADSAGGAAFIGVPQMDSLSLAFALAGVEALRLGRRAHRPARRESLRDGRHPAALGPTAGNPRSGPAAR